MDQNILFLQHRVAYVRDERSYKQLFLHYHPRLYKFALGIIKNPEWAEEIVSDVMFNIWSMQNRLAHVDNLTTYLLKATRNTALNYVKKIAETQEIQENLLQLPDSMNPESQLLVSEIRHIMEQTIRLLPAQCQMVYRLIKEEGLSYKEAGYIMELSQNTLETHMRIALKRIRLALDGYLLEKK